MEVKIVLGYTFGDEGKGATVQWLCKKAISEGKKPLVIRFSGGPQAGHNIYNNGIHHCCSTYGAGALLGVDTFILGKFNTYFDPISANIERKALLEKGVDARLKIGWDIMTVTPYDVFDNMANKKNLKDGSCGKGLYSTYKRAKKRSWLPLIQYNPIKNDYVHTEPERLLDIAASFYKVERIKEFDDLFIDSLNEMYEHMESLRKDIIFGWNADNVVFSYDDNVVCIFEGSQGFLLDADCGLYPNVTPSLVGLNAIGERYLQDAEVYLVTRSYTTRHGNGYDPLVKLPHPDMYYKDGNNIKNEFQGEFKVGGLELPLLRMAEHRHCLDNNQKRFNLKFNLVVTHCDKMEDYFIYMDEERHIRRLVLPSPKDICTEIAKNSILDFQSMYYSVNNESDFGEIKQ